MLKPILYALGIFSGYAMTLDSKESFTNLDEQNSDPIFFSSFEVYPHADARPKTADNKFPIGMHGLEEKWKYFLISELLHQRLEKCANQFHGFWAYCFPRCIFPQSISIIEEAEKNAVNLFHDEINFLKKEGFLEEEFRNEKQKWIEQLQIYAFKEMTKNNNYSIQFNLIDPLTFATTSKNILENLQLSDLISYIPNFLNDELNVSDWHFDEGPPNAYISFVDHSLDDGTQFFLIDNAYSGSIESFYQLPLEDREQKLIQELIKTMAEKSIWGLLFKKRDLEKIGKKINQVHPMRFMGYILSEPKLKKSLREIKNSSFKWDHFIDGFSNRMKEEQARNNLMPYIPGMAHLLKINQDRISQFIHSKDYEGLVKALL